jgi:alpha-N-arabinofuranosidase
MDGPWQICAKSAAEYGDIARKAGKMMKWYDPTIELVACGSSNYNMPTFGEWEYTVLDKAYNQVDYISLHQYYNNAANNTPDFLGRSVHLDAFIKSVAAICDAVKAKKHSDKTVNLSLDEYNVWYHSNGTKVDDWLVAPPILEDVYNFEDALLIGSILITLHNNCDRVKMACMAQLVNVIAPIMTECGGKAWAQTIFYPYMLASNNGRGTTLRSIVKSESYVTRDKFTVPYLEASVVDSPDARTLTVFAVNKSLDEDMTLTLDLGGYEGANLVSHTELYCDDLKAENTKDVTNVAPTEREIPANGAPVNLKKHSFNMLKFAY